ncbi:site-specific recombinase XerD [Desulfitobacterium dichloroeliminans LMG P-21439]|uniref:Site-specific recombinase XerD n=2 Tax=Desulfitobacterium dichloroeliminans TaxID=233055 RepID=L0F436_DESDL|nr:site-specific recombinase XerD [Desulfitobacterium dichloroeliminans LMG P-21439]
MPTIRQRGKNKYQIEFFLTVRKDGGNKKVRHYETFHGTEAKAREYSYKRQAELKSKNLPNSCGMTMGELFQRFLQYKKTRIERSTYEKYESHIRKLTELLGHLFIASLDSLQIEEKLLLLDQGNLSARTIKNYYTTLRTITKWGLKKKYLAEDVMDGLEPPMVRHKKRDILNPEELKLFIETAKNYKLYLPLKILAITGMRVGEVMGLKWKSVSFEDSQIKIVEAVSSNSGYLKDTKTQGSKRELRLDTETMAELKEHKLAMAKCNRAKDDDFVFQRETSNDFLGYQNIFRTKNRILKRAGLRNIRIHDLRHGVGSILLDKGASITTVAEQLGQVPATTAGNYSHSLKKGQSILDVL